MFLSETEKSVRYSELTGVSFVVMRSKKKKEPVHKKPVKKKFISKPKRVQSWTRLKFFRKNCKEKNVFRRTQMVLCRRILNKIKQFYSKRGKLNYKFKFIQNYFGGFYRQRFRNPILIERSQKRTHYEYSQAMLFKKTKDLQKQNRQFKSKQIRRLILLNKSSHRFSTFGQHVCQLSKLRLTSSVDRSTKTKPKPKRTNNYEFHFNIFSRITSIDDNKYIYHYSNQQIFIYRKFSTSKVFIKVISTLD